MSRAMSARLLKLERKQSASTKLHLFTGPDARADEMAARAAGQIGAGPVLIVSWEDGVGPQLSKR